MGNFSKLENFLEHQNYISQDNDNTQPTPRYTTRATTRSIMQEAMLSCIDLTHPTFRCHPRANVLPQTSNDMVLQDGKLSSWKQRQTTRISAPDCQPNNTCHVDLLVRKQNWKVSTRNAGTKHGDKYFSLHTTVYPGNDQRMSPTALSLASSALKN
jgi:hypothetical protein